MDRNNRTHELLRMHHRNILIHSIHMLAFKIKIDNFALNKNDM